MLGDGVVVEVRDLHPLAACPRQPLDTGIQDVSGEAVSLVRFFGSHRLDQTDSGDEVGPEQAICSNRAVGCLDVQIE